jgi:hypothetical protein
MIDTELKIPSSLLLESSETWTKYAQHCGKTKVELEEVQRLLLLHFLVAQQQ